MTSPPNDTQADFLAALRGDLGPLPPGPQTRPREEIAEVHRRRIIAGMAQALATNGIARTTIADVVREAQVSRRTFYELFADKTTCLMATYDACTDLQMRFIEDAVEARAGQPWQDRITAGIRAYLEIMRALPDLARVLIVELPSAGPEALARVRAGHARFAALVVRLAELHREDLPAEAEMDQLTAVAIVGGINELVLQALAAGENPHSPMIERTAMRLVVGALIGAQDGAAAS